MGFRVAVVEDDDFTRSMLVSALTSLGHQVSIDTARPQPLLTHMQTYDVDVAVLDLHLGKGPTGLDLAVVLRRLKPSIGIVILTSYEEPRLLRANLPALPQGAIYLKKVEVSSMEKLNDSIEESMSAKSETSKSEQSAAVGANSLNQLSDGQLEIMRLLSQGLSNSEIAKRRFITEKAVEISISRMAKLLKVERNQSRNQRMHMAKAYFRALGVKLDDDEQ